MGPQESPVPVQPTIPQPVMAVPTMHPVNPGSDSAVTGMILAFFIPIIGVVFSILGLRKSKRAGQKNALALAGLIVSTLLTVAAGIVLFFGISMLIMVSNKCQELGSGTHYIDSTTKIQCE